MKPVRSRLRRGSASIYKYIKREQFIREPCKCDKQILETAETKIIWIFSGKGAPLGKTWWSILLLAGIVVTVYNVVMCSTKYYNYPTITKETFESSVAHDNRINQFPKITICLNSMHSRKALINVYSEHVHNVTTFLYGFYGDNHGEDFSSFWNEITDSNDNILDSIDLEKFMQVTRPELEILSCRFMNEPCKKQWKDVQTVYGVCKQMETTAEMFKDPNKQTAAFGRQSSLSIVAQYNSSDWGSGWAHFIDGCTVYISPRHEETLDPDDSVILNPGSVPIVSIRQRKHKKLPYPFSTCMKRESDVLKYFNLYTKKHCIYECLIDLVIKSCKCVEYGFKKRPKNCENWDCLSTHRPFGADEIWGWKNLQQTVKMCTFTEHAFCVSTHFTAFNHMRCNCTEECDYEVFYQTNMQYANLRLDTPEHNRLAVDPPEIKGNNTDSARKKVTSFLLYQTDLETELETEFPEYTSFEFFSDIGGTVGLMLGLSAASVISILETLFAYMWHSGKKAIRESLISRESSEHERSRELETKIECLNTL